MGFFDSIFGSNTPEKDGLAILQAYYDEAKNFPEFQYGTFDAWLSYLNSRIGENFANFVGELVQSNYASTTVDQAANRLFQLANQSGGQASIPEIVRIAGGSGDTVNWSAALPEIGLETVQDVADLAYESAQNISEGVTGSLNLIKYLPWIVVGGGALAIYAFSSGTGKKLGKGAGRALEESGRGIRSLSEAAAERIRRK